VFSEKWLQADHVVPISFKNLILPEKFAAPTKLLDIKNKSIKEIKFLPAELILNKKENLTDFSII
jgi:pre-mRNA-splicing helicase BRR2